MNELKQQKIFINMQQTLSLNIIRVHLKIGLNNNFQTN